MRKRYRRQERRRTRQSLAYVSGRTARAGGSTASAERRTLWPSHAGSAEGGGGDGAGGAGEARHGRSLSPARARQPPAPAAVPSLGHTRDWLAGALTKWDTLCASCGERGWRKGHLRATGHALCTCAAGWLPPSQLETPVLCAAGRPHASRRRLSQWKNTAEGVELRGGRCAFARPKLLAAASAATAGRRPLA